MKKLDVEALLAKNPQVDAKLLSDTTKRMSEFREANGNRGEKPVVSPYGGRRLLLDQEGKDRTRYSHTLKDLS